MISSANTSGRGKNEGVQPALPLVPGSLTAQTLVRLWKGNELYFIVPTNDVEAAYELIADIATHVAQRAGVCATAFTHSDRGLAVLEQMMESRLGPLSENATWPKVLCATATDSQLKDLEDSPVSEAILPGNDAYLWQRGGLVHVQRLFEFGFNSPPKWRDVPLDVLMAGMVSE
jgi:hypothetical protein